MINLQVKSNNACILLDDSSNKKQNNESGKKDFSNILKKQSINHDKSNNSKIKDKKDKSTNEKLIDEDDEQIKNIDSEINDIFQAICNLIVELDGESIQLDEIKVKTLEQTIKGLENLMEQASEDVDLPFTRQDMVETHQAIESLVLALKEELDQPEVNGGKNSKKTKLNELLFEANKIKDQLRQVKTDIQSDKQDIKGVQDKSDIKHSMNTEKENIKLDSLSNRQEKLNIDEMTVEDLSKEGQGIKEDENSNIFSLETMDSETSKEISQVLEKHLPIIDEKEIIEQIVDKVKLEVSDEKQEIKIQLKPEALGQLMLKIESEKGVLLAKIMVDNYRTKELIEANLHQFKEDMEENGLEIKTFEVFVGNNDDFEKENKQKFKFNKKSKKLNIKDKGIEEIKVYDDTIVKNSQLLYNKSQLNLFA